MNVNIGLLGNGSQADEVESYLGVDQKVAFRAVSVKYITPSRTLLIDIDNPKDYRTTPVIAAVGAPAIRKNMVTKWSGISYISLVSAKAVVDKSVVIGEGTVIAPGAVVTTNIVVGSHSLINIGTTINHDCKIGNFVTISPGVHIAGNVKIGDGVFVGIGAILSNDITIASGCVIGAGTIVLHDVIDENSVILGVPGKIVKKNNGWLSEI